MKFFERLKIEAARSGSASKIMTAVSALLLLALGVQGARLLMAFFTPSGAVGAPLIATGSPAANATAAKFDPFFSQTSETATGVVTSLPLKLFGTRIDFATGRGSAIIATPDGLQSSFSVGETIQAGTKLLTVAGDFIELERGGVKERLYLDQSVPAPTAIPTGPAAPSTSSPSLTTAPPPPPSAVPVASPPAPVTQVQQTSPSGADEQQNQ